MDLAHFCSMCSAVHLSYIESARSPPILGVDEQKERGTYKRSAACCCYLAEARCHQTTDTTFLVDSNIPDYVGDLESHCALVNLAREENVPLRFL